METKKSKSADLENKKGYFFELGLVVAILTMVGAMSWSQPKREVTIKAEEPVVVQQEMVEITVQEDKRPPAPVKTQAVMISDIIEIVKNDTKIQEDLTIFDLDITDDIAVDVGKYGGTYTGEGEVGDEDVPVVISEDMPSFQGGDQNTFSRWVQSTMKYPPIALDNNVEGKVRVSFVVERDGSVSSAKVTKGVDRELDKAAIDKIMSSPKWSPGKNRGKAVRVLINMTVSFVINPDE